MIKKFLPLIVILIVLSAFFRQFFLSALLPIPSDTLVGLYHPFRDFYATEYSRGVPFKNFLLTDPIRQEYIWRYLGVDVLKRGNFPIWNPYTGLGMPLLANQQSALWYPLNIFYFFFPFALTWSIQIFLSLVGISFFTYLYLRKLKISMWGCLLGSISIAFSGFVTAWLEWNTVVQSFLWLPFILWAIEKVFEQRKITKKVLYTAVISAGWIFSLFAGHLQTFFYVWCLTAGYFILKIFTLGYARRIHTALLMVSLLVFGLVSLVQLIPTFQLILLSARAVDVDPTKAGWFIPVNQLIQFFIPDFFGNPATLNYSGVWNYAEMIGYIGVVPLIFSFLGGLFVRRKIIYFFLGVIIISLLFATQNCIAQLPFIFHIPFLATSQPTRLLSVIDFSFVVLAAFGMDELGKIKLRQRLFVLIIFVIFFAGTWIVLLFGQKIGVTIPIENVLVAKRNSLLPSILMVGASLILLTITYIKNKKVVFWGLCFFMVLTVYDGLRFAGKFTPFTSSAFLFPTIKTMTFLANNTNGYRYMTTDDRILPPNVGAYYKLSSLDVYDPLYLERYGEFIAAMQRGKPSITPPFGFNRIIAPHNIASPFINLLGVKYVVSLDTITNAQMVKVFQEGKTKVYENKKVFPRTFFAKEIVGVSSRKEAITVMYEKKNQLLEIAVVEGVSSKKLLGGSAKILSYSSSRVVLQTESTQDGFLILSDMYYPTWHAFVDGIETKIYPTDYVLRGIFVPKGKHTIAFGVKLF